MRLAFRKFVVHSSPVWYFRSQDMVHGYLQLLFGSSERFFFRVVSRRCGNTSHFRPWLYQADQNPLTDWHCIRLPCRICRGRDLQGPLYSYKMGSIGLLESLFTSNMLVKVLTSSCDSHSGFVLPRFPRESTSLLRIRMGRYLRKTG
jgi:hypothetical protein